MAVIMRKALRDFRLQTTHNRFIEFRAGDIISGEHVSHPYVVDNSAPVEETKTAASPVITQPPPASKPKQIKAEPA